MKNKNVRQDDPLENLADALTEDILNTPDGELLREVEEDCGDPRALANKFDQILERAEKQVFGTTRSAASPQVRSSVLDLPYRVLEWFSTLFGSGPGRSGTQFQLFSVNRSMVWAGAAAVLIVLVLAPAVFRSVSKFDERSEQLAAREKEQLVRSEQLAAQEKELLARSEQLAAQEKELLARVLLAAGRQLIVAGDIPTARLMLQEAAEAGNATAALELGATYDPIELEKLGSAARVTAVRQHALPDIAKARIWYQKAKDLGSTEAAGRLERLRSDPNPRR